MTDEQQEAAPEPGSVDALRADSAFVARYLSGDTEAKATMHAAIERNAAPKDDGDGSGASRITDPAAAAADQDEPGHAVPEGAQSPFDYRLSPPEDTELDLSFVKSIGEALHGAGVPKELGDGLWARAVHLHEAGQDVADQELRARSGWSQMVQSRGEDVAKQTVRDAIACLDQASAKFPLVWEWMHTSGLANDRWAVESLANLYRAQSPGRRGA